MISWITETLATGPYGSVDIPVDACVVDVRDLVDKAGNAPSLALAKIEQAVAGLTTHKRVVICCDYGISRSNSIAVGVLARIEGISVDSAIRLLVSKTGEKRMNLGVLSVVRAALSPSRPASDTNTIVLTGAGGAVGQRLLPRLRQVATVVAPTRAEVDLVEGAVDLDLLVNATGASTIVHLANPRVYTTPDAMGPALVMLKHVLAVCAQAKVGLLYLSNWEVYSAYRTTRLLADESLPHLPGGTYGQTKALSEQLIQHEGRTREFPVALLRAATTYGSGSKPKFLHQFVTKARAGVDIVAHRFRNGFPTLDLLHVDDLAEAIVAAVTRGLDGVVNIGSGRGVSTTDVAGAIVTALDSPSRILHRDIDADAPNIVMDSARAHRILGWTPQVNFADGLSRLLNS